jgi:hypothetical protein
MKLSLRTRLEKLLQIMDPAPKRPMAALISVGQFEDKHTKVHAYLDATPANRRARNRLVVLHNLDSEDDK